jgi:D-alanine-D-alanine ligase
MKIALILNPLAVAPTEEEHRINLTRRARHNRIITETIRSSGHEIEPIEYDDQFKNHLLKFSPDLVFLQTFRADPEASILRIQAELDELNLPYTGSPPAACRAAQNKFLAKEKIRQAGLPTPRFALIEKDQAMAKKPANLEYPLFFKPLYGGCSMGIHPENPVWDDEGFAYVLEETQAATEQQVLVEEFIDGREFTAGILGNHPPTALPLIEFTALARKEDPVPFRLFDAKTDMEIQEPIECPADIKEGEKQRIQEIAVKAFSALGCYDYARVDIRCDKRGNPFVLEVNVHPSLLPSSSLPIMAEKAGIGYPQLFEHIFQSALSRYRMDA